VLILSFRIPPRSLILLVSRVSDCCCLTAILLILNTNLCCSCSYSLLTTDYFKETPKDMEEYNKGIAISSKSTS
jgi:hypothetical protein